MLNDAPRTKVMVDRLFDLVACDAIANEWEEAFIDQIHTKMQQGGAPSLKQQAIIEQLFDKY